MACKIEQCNCIIEWCNRNSGFVSAVLSLITIIFSIIAIVISIFGGSFGTKIDEKSKKERVNAVLVECCNVGNRAINITFFGLAIGQKTKNPREKYKLIKAEVELNRSGFPLKPTELFSVLYSPEVLISELQKTDEDNMVYFYLKDSGGKIITKKNMKVNEMLRKLKE